MDQQRNKALFLDRDGIVNQDKGYVSTHQDFVFTPGIFALCTRAQDLGFHIIIVTNQSGIGRGYYTEADFQSLNTWMLARFKQQGIYITAVYHCPHHPTAAQDKYLQACLCRKPEPGMLLTAEKEHHINLSRSILIGDSERDIIAGKRAGVGKNILHQSSSFSAVDIEGYLQEKIR